jgi:hypothetical protein
VSGSRQAPPPENLTHCCECGVRFAVAVTEEQAMRDFPSLDVAAYNCSWCEVGVTDEFMVKEART